MNPNEENADQPTEPLDLDEIRRLLEADISPPLAAKPQPSPTCECPCCRILG